MWRSLWVSYLNGCSDNLHNVQYVVGRVRLGNLQESQPVYHLPLFTKPHARISVRDRGVDRHFVVPETQTSESATTEWNVGRRGEGGWGVAPLDSSSYSLKKKRRKFIPPSTSCIYLIMRHYYYCHHHQPPSRFFPISPPYFCFTLPVLCIAPSSFLHISILSPPLLQGLILLELHTTLHSTLTSYYIEDPAERRNTAATIRGLAE